MTSPPPSSNRRAWWTTSRGGEERIPPDKLDLNHRAAPSLTTPMSATTPSTSTTTAWTSAVHHSQHLQPERTPLRNRPPFTPVSPPTQLKDPRRDPSREYEPAPPRESGPIRSSREFDTGPRTREIERARHGARHGKQDYEGERLPGVREVGRLPHEYEMGGPRREYEASRPRRGYEGREIRLPPLEYGGDRGDAPRIREGREERTDKGREKAGSVRKLERHEHDEHDDDDDEHSTSHRSQTAADTSASPAPGGFNGWESATLYYHAIHRLPPLSSWCGTVLEMALKSCDTWVVSRHANDLPSYARIMAFYGGERGEPPSSRATSEKGSIKGVGSASASASDVSRSDPEAVLAGEIVTVGAFARRMETVIDALQTQMAPYDLTMPRTHLVGAWREIGERITARSNAERRREGSSRHTASEESESTRAEKSARTRKRRREREDGPVTGILPVLIGRDWIVAAADTVTGLVLIYDAGHALDATEADIVRDEVMRAVAETIGQEPMRVEVRHLRPPDRVPQRHTVLLACAALEMFGSSPAPIGDRSLPVYLGLWSKLLAQGITLAIPPSFDRPSAAQSPLYTKDMSASRVLRDRIVWTIHTGMLACPFRGYW